jgi:phage tail sheath protein FI
MGRKAQRVIVSNAMKSALDSSTELREDSRNFNVIATPGYPELISNMVSLNNDRRQSGFVIGDAPFRLNATSTDLQNWATNTNAASDNSEDGLVTSDPYLAVFYPSALSNDLSNNSVVVPASHAMLRTFARSDDISFQWFAPAGSRRGLLDNVSSIGYINKSTSEFVTDNVRESLRDTLYSNRVNPLTFFQGQGLMNYGNKTRAVTTSALDRINVARLVAYLRKQLQSIALGFVFEPNDKITRDEIKQQVESTLNDLVAKRGIYDYLVVCDETNNTTTRIDANQLYIDVAIEPVKAAEFIFIPIRLKNTGEIASGNIAAANTV